MSTIKNENHLIPHDNGPPIVIGGASRSGTTLIQKLLNRHSKIAGIHETLLIESEQLRSFPDMIWQLDGSQRMVAISDFKHLIRTSAYRRRAKTEDEVYTGLCVNFTSEQIEKSLSLIEGFYYVKDSRESHLLLGQFMNHMFMQYASANGKSLWAEKTPLNCWFYDFWHSCLPDALFINMIRDGRDRVCSLMKVPWWHKSSLVGFDEWAVNIGNAFKALEGMPPKRCIHLRYEDLVLRTEETLSILMSFLGLELEDEMLSYGVQTKSVGRWRNELSAEELAYAQEKYADIFRIFKYPLV